MEKKSIDFILIFPLLLLSFVIVLIIVNVAVYVRRKFPVKVNCWFCNQWTKVPYNSKDAFECPACLQYNGFSKDGGYNKVLPEQYDVSSTKSVSGKYTQSNGLCQLCNNNQKLRVFQLANFVPLDEANYDTEIEHFQKQLDKAYKLCRQCQKTVQTTIRKQNCLLGIDVQKRISAGFSMMDLTQTTSGLKRMYFRKIVFYAIVVFSILNICYVLRQNVLINSVHLQKAKELCSNYSKDVFSRFDVEQLWEAPYVSDFLVVVEVAWMSISDVFTSLTEALFGNALVIRTQFWLFFVGLLLQLVWLCVNPENFKKNVFISFVSLIMLLLDLGYISYSKVDVETLSLPVAILNILSMWLSYTAIKTKQRKPPSKLLKKKIKQKTIFAEDDTPKPTVTDESCFISKLVNDTPLITLKDKRGQHIPAENLFVNNADLDVSLNKLHIGTTPLKRSPPKTSWPVLERPRPVISPARFQFDNYQTNQSQNSRNLYTSQSNFAGFACNSFYSPPVCNIGPQSPFNHTCCPQYSCGGSVYRPLINNEQLVYISPNYLQSGDLYEILRQNFSNGIFDASYNESFNKQQFQSAGYKKFN
ncbi:hypothetical protein PPYR_12335 [Photinus pyralis]|uniref:Ima1 N-terminal domain-containing protein n=1 Tax=Photinus pyralis TaxID=7054 RepID=A0A1Y1KDT2_PHOPY|nr:uncharacterized protein LOC116175308 [Photinus pyralis]KAB0795496.1 hypothetical protein PPYR_12335 [Photinus pyralis]